MKGFPLQDNPHILKKLQKNANRWRKRERSRAKEKLQSEETPEYSAAPGGSLDTEENLVFGDSKMGDVVDLGTMSSGAYDQDADSSAGLGDFLSRPVRIATFSWAQGGGFTQSIAPWSLYFNTSQIKNKLQNFGKISCRLRVKILVNASPFHYGSVRACYFPLSDPRGTFTSVADLIPFSQVPGVYIEPQNMDVTELTLPFLWPHNWLEVTSLAQFTRMGTLNFTEYAPLKSANGATSSATISVYAWAEDVKLMGLTTIGALQSDEYVSTSGTISGPATAVANIASRLTDVPVVGPFAKATELGASMVAGVARLFGYSNPPMINDVMPFQNKSFHAFANSETRMPIDKLCLDPKNEVTVASGVAGVEEDDPLAFSRLLTHESYLTVATMTGSNAVDTLLWSAIVNPHYAYNAAGYRTMPPVTYFSPNFRFWRGSLVYKFKFVKTRFHRGRVLISYDPNGDITGTADTETSTFSRIVDLEQESEVEFEVPYKATSPLLQVPLLQTWPGTYSTTVAPAYTYSSTFHNGVITMRVQTALTGPTTTADISILSYVRAGDDFMFAGPAGLDTVYTTRDPAGVIQSSEVEDIAQKKPQIDVHIGLITTGEVIASMRPICHRSHYIITQYAGNLPGTSIGNVTARNYYYRVPPGFGRADNGYNNGNPALPYGYNFSQNNPIDWVLNCFVGYRGSMTLHANPIFGGNNVKEISSLSISRRYATVRNTPNFNSNGETNIYITSGANSVAGWARSAAGYGPTTGAGTTLTNPRTQAACSANLPQYWPLRFYQAFQSKRDLDPKTDNPLYDNFSVRMQFNSSIPTADGVDWPSLEIYQSAGVDFAPIQFLCTPRVFVTNVPLASDTA